MHLFIRVRVVKIPSMTANDPFLFHSALQASLTHTRICLMHRILGWFSSIFFYIYVCLRVSLISLLLFALRRTIIAAVKPPRTLKRGLTLQRKRRTLEQ